MNEHGLNAQQKTFADLMVAGKHSASAAYVQAGYSARGADGAASKLQRIAKVAAYIRAERKALSELSRMEKWEYVDFLAGTIDDPMQEMRMKLDAGKQMSALLGWLTPEKESERPVNVVVNIGGSQGV